MYTLIYLIKKYHFPIIILLLLALWIPFVVSKAKEYKTQDELIQYIPYTAESYVHIKYDKLVNQDKFISILNAFTKEYYKTEFINDIKYNFVSNIAFANVKDADNNIFTLFITQIKSEDEVMKSLLKYSNDLDFQIKDNILIVSSKPYKLEEIKKIGSLKNNPDVVKNLETYSDYNLRFYIKSNSLYGVISERSQGYSLKIYDNPFLHQEADIKNIFLKKAPENTILLTNSLPILKDLENFDHDFIKLFIKNQYLKNLLNGQTELLVTREADLSSEAQTKIQDFILIIKDNPKALENLKKIKRSIIQTVAKNHPVIEEKKLPDGSFVNELLVDPENFRFDLKESDLEYTIEVVNIEHSNDYFVVGQPDEKSILISNSLQLVENLNNEENIDIMSKISYECLKKDKDEIIKYPYFYINPKIFFGNKKQNDLITFLSSIFNEVIFLSEGDGLQGCFF